MKRKALIAYLLDREEYWRARGHASGPEHRAYFLGLADGYRNAAHVARKDKPK